MHLGHLNDSVNFGKKKESKGACLEQENDRSTCGCRVKTGGDKSMLNRSEKNLYPLYRMSWICRLA